MEVAGGPPIPVSLSLLLNLPFAPPIELWREGVGRPELIADLYRVMLYHLFRDRERPFVDLSTISLTEARANFSSRASSFLAARFAARRWFQEVGSYLEGRLGVLNLRKYAGGASAQVVGCRFSVTTNSPGLSAYWSGAYYISPNYFGAPTSPTVGVLQAGTYVFGINGGAYGNNVQWDTNAVCTLPGSPNVHLQY